MVAAHTPLFALSALFGRGSCLAAGQTDEGRKSLFSIISQR